MQFTYIKTPIHRYTFKSKKIRDWVEKNVEGMVLNLFAGMTNLQCNEVRNDIDEKMMAHYHLDALEFCKTWNHDKFNTVLLDPPYSYRKSMEKYNGNVASSFNRLKDEIIKIIESDGIVITFGYHSVSMGKSRGFEQEHILLINHGGAIHDTIAVIERNTNELKDKF